jgi:hypothetical protein
MSSRVTFVLSAQRSRIKRIFRKWTSSCSQYRHKDSGKLYCSPSRASHRNTIRETLIKLRGSLVGENLPLLIFVNKGIETATQALTLEIIADTCGSDIARAATFIVGQRVRHSNNCENSLHTVWTLFRRRELVPQCNLIRVLLTNRVSYPQTTNFCLCCLVDRISGPKSIANISPTMVSMVGLTYTCSNGTPRSYILIVIQAEIR